MKVANTQSSTHKFKRLFNALLRGKEIFEYFLSLLLADLMKRVVANLSSWRERESPVPASRLGSSNLAAMSWPIKLDLALSPFLFRASPSPVNVLIDSVSCAVDFALRKHSSSHEWAPLGPFGFGRHNGRPWSTNFELESMNYARCLNNTRSVYGVS